MSDNYQIELIKRLKRQPRHGQGISPITQVENALKQLFDVYKIGGDEIVKLNIFGKIATQINAVVNDLTILQDLNQGLAKDFNLNSEAAAKLGVAFDKMSSGLKINMQKAKGYAGEVREVIGFQTKLYENQTGLGTQIAKQNDQFRNSIGLTDEANRNFLAYGLASAEFYNKTFGAAAEGFADVAGHLDKIQGYDGAFTDIVSQFDQISSTTRVTFGRLPENLGLAIVKATKLGTTVDSLVESGKGMLDYAESYGREVEFAALTGKELTTLNNENLMNEYQKAYLQKDANRMAELYAGFIQKYGEDLRDNVLTQEVAANIFGQTSDQLFTAMEKMAGMQQSMKATGEGSVGSFFATTADQIQKANYNLTEVINTENELSKAQQITDQNIRMGMEQLGDYSTEVAQINSGLMAGSAAAMQGAGRLGTTAVNAMGGIPGAVGGALRVGSIVTDMITSAVTNPGQLFTRDESNPLTSKDDVFIPSSAGTVVSGPFGSFALNAKDDILAMPGIGKAVGNGGGGGGESIGTAVAAALKGMSFHVTNVFDGKKIRSSLQILEQSTLNNTNVG
jgi:hypothetical protein